MKHSILKYAGMNAAGTAIYIVFVALFLSSAEKIFGSKAEDTFLIPIAMLLLLVLSASLTGSLVLGRPLLWYLDGKKKEAVTLFMATLGFLFLLTFLAFSTLAMFTR